MTKYDQDMEGIDLKIQVKKNEYQNMYDKRIYLENTVRYYEWNEWNIYLKTGTIISLNIFFTFSERKTWHINKRMDTLQRRTWKITPI